MSKKWSPESWRGLPIRQVPGYADEAALHQVETTLRRYPPLVFAGEARRLQDRLADLELARPADPAGPRLRRRSRAAPGRDDAAPLPAAGLRRRGAPAAGSARRC